MNSKKNINIKNDKIKLKKPDEILAENDKLVIIAKKILKKHKYAFEVLGND